MRSKIKVLHKELGTHATLVNLKLPSRTLQEELNTWIFLRTDVAEGLNGFRGLLFLFFFFISFD